MPDVGTYTVRGVTGEDVLYLLVKLGGAEIVLPSTMTLRVLRIWISSALLDSDRPKSRRHAQVLAAVEAAMRSPGLRYVHPWPDSLDAFPSWVELLVEISNGR